MLILQTSVTFLGRVTGARKVRKTLAFWISLGHNDEDPKDDQNTKPKDESTDQKTSDEIEEDDEEEEVEQTHGDQTSPQASNAKTAASTYEEKQRQLLLADCQRLKKKMTQVKNSIERPPL